MPQIAQPAARSCSYVSSVSPYRRLTAARLVAAAPRLLIFREARWRLITCWRYAASSWYRRLRSAFGSNVGSSIRRCRNLARHRSASHRLHWALRPSHLIRLSGVNWSMGFFCWHLVQIRIARAVAHTRLLFAEVMGCRESARSPGCICRTALLVCAQSYDSGRQQLPGACRSHMVFLGTVDTLRASARIFWHDTAGRTLGVSRAVVFCDMPAVFQWRQAEAVSGSPAVVHMFCSLAAGRLLKVFACGTQLAAWSVYSGSIVFACN